MILRTIDLGHVWNASGARNFDGSGWWYHAPLKLFGLNFKGSTLQAKTTTLEARAGNMRLATDGKTPLERMPKCIYVDLRQGIALNAVGLSGPGAQFLLENSGWQQRTDPIVISFMSVEATSQGRLGESLRFIELLRAYLPKFKAPVALAINFSCPNVGLKLASLQAEVSQTLDFASVLNIPLIAKFNALLPIEAALRFAEHRELDAICMSNTIPWGELSEQINWKQLFGSDVSPLAHYGFGNGGLSGAPLLPIVCDWIIDARQAGFTKPIIGCGGILSSDDADRILDAGANAIELGSVAFLRPWRVQRIIRHINQRCL